jgi:ABC-type amino acid transport substrate-binding protein
VLFAAWYSQSTLAASAYPGLAVAGIVSLFGHTYVALPFLLDLARVPADTFQLFVAAGVLNSRFSTLAGASHVIVLALVGSYALSGRLSLVGSRVLRYAVVTAGLMAVTVGTLALGLRALGSRPYEGARVASRLGLLRPASPGARVLAELPVEPLRAPHEGVRLLEAVRERGFIRIGFVEGQRPYSHYNALGELVGFDVEMAHELALELGVSAEFAPVERDHLADVIESGRVDVVMAGIIATTERADRVTFSDPYLDETLAFLLPDHQRAEFSDAARVRARKGLRLGVPDLPYAEGLVAREFPRARIVPIPLADVDPFAVREEPVDAFVLTAERGAFLTLLHPAFSVAVPHPLEIRLPLAYPVARHDVEAARFLSVWIALKKRDGTIQALYDHWIRGLDAAPKTPRWSILRDVLGWEE